MGDVEAFLGLTRDAEAHTGMMIALEGYTPAAINRVYHDDLDVILDVLNFDELKHFQGVAAIPYAGEHAVNIAAPFGWVVDATRQEGMLAALYQRGLTFEEALRNQELMYINFWNKKDKEVKTLESLLEFQKAYMLRDSPGAEIQFLEGVQSQQVGAKTLIRRFKKKTYPTPEYTGFVDFEDFIFMCVLFSPEQLERKNLRKLRFVLRGAFPMKITRDNTNLIKAATEKLREPLTDQERARLLSEIGYWYRDMNRPGDARSFLEQSLALVPNHYETIKQLLAVLTKIEDKEAALRWMGTVLRLDPGNPTVFDDCLIYARGSTISWSDLLGLFESLKTEYPDKQLVQATCDFYVAKLMIAVDPAAARKRFVSAQTTFRKVLPSGHQVFAVLRSALRELGKADKPHPPSMS